jgi:hypothetical protein
MSDRGLYRKRTSVVPPFIGNYFIFLTNAQDLNPVKIYFKDHEAAIKGKKIDLHWNEKIYLYPTLVQRKWIDYKYRDRFIQAVKYDNVLPLELGYTFLNRVGVESIIKVRSIDKIYRNIGFHLFDSGGERVFHTELKRISVGRESILNVKISTPGIYTLSFSSEELTFSKSPLVYFNRRIFIDLGDKDADDYKLFLSYLEKRQGNIQLYCNHCKTPFKPMIPLMAQGYIHKNYIPVKEYLDIDNLGMDFISSFIMKMEHPMAYRRGLVHLLNMLRLATVEDEVTIVTNLFKDDPSFAYFITDRLFLFNMIPVMENRELQRILGKIDDSLLSVALKDQNKHLITKVLRNVSKRRSDRILYDLRMVKNGQKGAKARAEIHRIIKSFFEERFGRELRIPSGSKLIYRESVLDDTFLQNPGEIIFNHTGSFILFTGSHIFELFNYNETREKQAGKISPDQLTFQEKCLQYDTETYHDRIFSITGVTESTLYLRSSYAIRYALIHVYNWTNSLEDYETVENISRFAVIPLRLYTSGIVLTIGAIDAKGRPHEQVIRLKTKGGKS